MRLADASHDVTWVVMQQALRAAAYLGCSVTIMSHDLHGVCSLTCRGLMAWKEKRVLTA